MRTILALIFYSAFAWGQGNPTTLVQTAHSWGPPPPPPRLSTYFGYAIGGADSGTVAGPGPQSITPPASMKAGDLVVVTVAYRGDAELSVSNNGGQAWDSTTAARGGANVLRVRAFWCEYDGTWDANPSFVNGGGGTLALNAMMHVFRPADSSNHVWSVDAGPDTARGAAPGSPYDCTRNGVTPSVDSTVIVAVFHSQDDNTWAPQSANWTAGEPFSGYQNLSGSDQSVHLMWRIMQDNVATGTVTNRQSVKGGDAWCSYILVFK